MHHHQFLETIVNIQESRKLGWSDYHDVKGSDRARKYNIDISVFIKWVNRFRKGYTLKGKVGRSPLFDETDKKEITDYFSSSSTHSITVESLQNKVHEVAIKSQNSMVSPQRLYLRKSKELKTVKISRRTLTRIKNELAIKDGNAERSTQARAKAVASKYYEGENCVPMKEETRDDG